MPKKNLKSFGKKDSSVIINNSNPKQFPWKWVVVAVVLFLLTLGGVMVYNASQSTNTNPSNPSNTDSGTPINLTVSKSLLQSLIDKESSVPVLNEVRSNSLYDGRSMNRGWMIGRVVGQPSAAPGQVAITGTNPPGQERRTGSDTSTGVGSGVSTAKRVYKREGQRRKRFNELSSNELKTHMDTFINKSKLSNNLKFQMKNKISQQNISMNDMQDLLKDIRLVDLFLEFKEKVVPLTGLKMVDCSIPASTAGFNFNEKEINKLFLWQSILCVLSKEWAKANPNVDVLTSCLILLWSFGSIFDNAPVSELVEINGNQFLIKGNLRNSIFDDSELFNKVYKMDISILEDNMSENMFGKVSASLSRALLDKMNSIGTASQPTDCILCDLGFSSGGNLSFGTGNYVINGSTEVRTGI